MLSATHLEFSYDGRAPVLRDASLALAAGSSIGLVGANGAGKTTLLGVLSGTIEGHCSGELKRPATPSWRRAIGYATQAIALNPLLTVGENMNFVARLTLGRHSAQAATDAALVEFGLERLADTMAHALSGGQRRMAHLACSFVHQPPIRLLDEPTVALDFDARERVVELVQAWIERGIAIVVTAHYPEDIEQMSTHLFELHQGCTRELGSTRSFLDAGSLREVLIAQRGKNGGE